MKKIYVDVETTGLSASTAAIIQLSGMVVIDMKVVDEFDIRMRPFEGAEISDGALDANGVTREQLAEYKLNYRQAFGVFEQVLAKHIDRYSSADKAWFCAYNSPFDVEFVRAFFKRNNNNYFGSWFWVPDRCIMRLAAHMLEAERHKLANFKLGTVAEYLKLTPIGNLHDAMTDIRLAIMVEERVKHIDMSDENFAEHLRHMGVLTDQPVSEPF